MSTIEFQGTGGIIEGNLGAANVNVNLDRSLMFDGINDFVQCGTDTDHDFTDHFTLACWAKNDNATTADGDREHLIAKYAGSSGQRIFRLYLHGSTLRFGVGYNSGNSSIEITHSMTGLLEHWNHYAATFDGGVMKLYVNGVLVTNTDNSGTLTAIHSNNAVEVNLGAYQDGSHTWTGQIADARIYNAVLTDANIQLLASKINTDSSLGAGTTNLKGYWKLNNETASGGGSGTGFIVDESGTVNQGTLTNFTGTYWDYDAYSVDVYDNSTQTTGDFTVTQGKVECLALSSVDLDGAAEYLRVADNNALSFGDGSTQEPFTLSAWINMDDATNFKILSKGILNTNGEYNFHVDGSDLLEIVVFDESVDNCQQGRKSTTALTSRQGDWIHVVATSGATTESGTAVRNTMKLYVDGVRVDDDNSGQNASSYDAMENGSAELYIGRFDNNYADGKIKDVKIFDYELSAEQVASLYSNTYPQTAFLHWKLDEGHTTESAVDAAGAFTETGTTGSLNATGTNLDASSCQNGTLDLNRQLTIATNGTLSAPRGTLEVGQESSSGTANLEIDFNGTFIHNNGLFQLVGYEQKIYFGGATFYNLESGKVNWNRKYVREAFAVANGLTVTKGFFSFDANINNYTATFSAGATINVTDISSAGIDFISNTSNAVTVQGDTVSPIAVTGKTWDFDLGGSGSTVKLSNIDYDPDVVTGGNGVTIQLTGDCEFDAVTVSNGDTLDCGTHDITTSGTLTVEGTFTGGSGLHNINSINANNSTGSLTLTSGITFLNGGGSSCFGLSSGLSNLSFAQGTLVFNQSDGNQRFEFNKAPGSNSKRMGRVVFNNGPNNAAFLNAVAWTSSTRVPTGDIIVASTDTSSGFLTNNFDLSTDGNMTIATGARFSAGSSELTVGGDFTTSGGLIGKSALTFDETAQSNKVAIPDDSTLDLTTAATLMAWVKIPTDAGSKQRIISKTFRAYEMSVESGRLSAYFGTDGAGGFTSIRSPASVDYRDGKWHHFAITLDGSSSLVKIYVDGKLVHEESSAVNFQNKSSDLSIGYRSDGTTTSNDSWMDGEIAVASVWNNVLTEAQIRSKIFSDFASLDSNTGCVAFYQFDEGSGTAVADSTSNNNDGTASSSSLWVGAGTFTYGTSTLTMAKSGTQKINFLSGEDIYNLTVNDGSTTELHGVDSTSALLDVYGDVVVNEKLRSPSSGSTNTSLRFREVKTLTVGSDVKTTALSDLYALNLRHSNGTIDLPELTTQRVILASSTNCTARATGDLTITQELELGNGRTFNANGNTITTLEADINGTGTLDLRNSTLSLAYNSAALRFEDNSILLSGNSTVTGLSSASKAFLRCHPDMGAELVGTLKFMKLEGGSHKSDITVIGAVIDCELLDSTANIRQFFHTLDTQQLLDADEAGDDDLKLEKPALDNAVELQTG